MDKGQAFAKDFLAHYASPYYDPVKAKAYYDRTKHLIGRKPAVKELKSKSQKEVWQVANSQIGEAKKADTKQLSDQRKQSVDQLRASIAERRDQISKQLTDALKAITDTQKNSAVDLANKQQTESKKISDDAASKIAALPEIPKGASKEEKAKLTIERNAAVAKIKGDANTAQKTLSDSLKNDRGTVQYLTSVDRSNKHNDAKSARDALATELQGTLDKARQDFKTKADALKAKYEQVTMNEFNNVKKNA